MALALSTKAKIAAATLTAATIIGGAFSASAQQMALGGPDMSACDKLSLTAPARAAQCRVDALKAQGVAARREGAAADVRIAAADAKISESDKLRGCISFLGAKKLAGVALAPERLTPKAACGYASELGMK